MGLFDELTVVVTGAGRGTALGSAAEGAQAVVSGIDNCDAITSVTPTGTFLCPKAEIASMLTTGGGITADQSLVAGFTRFSGLSPYVASKHGVAGLTRDAALEYARSGIRTNAVCPGGCDARMPDPLAEQAAGGAQTTAERMDPRHPIGRTGTPQKVAEPIVWLWSRRASFLADAITPVVGGIAAP